MALDHLEILKMYEYDVEMRDATVLYLYHFRDTIIDESERLQIDGVERYNGPWSMMYDAERYNSPRSLTLRDTMVLDVGC